MALLQGQGISIAILCFTSVANSMSISVTGPETGIAGDFEAFTCKLDGEIHMSHKTDVQWKYSMKNGEQAPVMNTDMLLPLEKRTMSEELAVTSFIKLRADMDGIVCEYGSKVNDSRPIAVKDLMMVSSEEEPCKKSQESGKPVVVMYTSSLEFIAPYRNGHYLMGNDVLASYPMDVAQTKLVCVSYDDSPHWTMEPGTMDKMRFAAWNQQTFGIVRCKRQVLDILEVFGQTGSVTELSFECKSGSASSGPVNLKFQFPFGRGSQPDFNQTENCVNTIVEQFYGKELTGVGIGSSFLIVLMMVGMAIMKKQMNQQQKINQGLQQSSSAPTTSSEPLHSTMESGGSNA